MTDNAKNPDSPRWRLGLLVAIAVVVVTSIPQISLIAQRGIAWHGSYALLDFDEVSYSAYLNGLIKGRARRSNPYLGKDSYQRDIGESYFSIQFLPAFAIALPSRLLGITASTAFIILMPLMAFLSSLAVFWLLFEVTRNKQTAAVGVLIVLLCGRLISETPFTLEQTYSSFAFLRRYLPSVPFPLFFLFCGFVWRAFISKSKISALAAGTTLALLIFSYFYLWTAAAAWALCFVILWLLAHRDDWRWVVKQFLIITIFPLCALVPYLYLLSRRAGTLDADQALMFSRAPDLFRVTEVIGLLVIAVLIVEVWRRRINWTTPNRLFIVSCSVTPLIVFNQQIITGITLQAFHYEQFIINYLVLTSLVVAYQLNFQHLRIRLIVWVVFAFCIGLVTAVKDTRHNSPLNVRRDQARLVFERLENSDSANLTLFNNSLLAASALTDSSMPQLWSPNINIYGGVNATERLERFYQYLYLLGVEPLAFRQDLENVAQVRAAVFGLQRVNSVLSQRFSPVSPEDIRAQVESYSAFVKNFSQHQANKWPLSYVVMLDDADYDFTNMDRWYNRSPGEKIGNSVLYAVQLKP